MIKRNTVIKEQVGSWYTPVYTKIYHWKNNRLILKAVFGKELVHYTMSGKNIPTFFAYQTINGVLKLTHQFASTDETNRKEYQISEGIFNKYNK